jgi:protein-histidine N-methyltransferase
MHLHSGLFDRVQSDESLQVYALPSQIAYNKLTLVASPTSTFTSSPSLSNVVLGRREISDIRAQLMVEDDGGGVYDNQEELISSLEAGDLRPNFYEGGFKTWECALDLARFVAADKANWSDGQRAERWKESAVHVIEVSCLSREGYS